MCVHVTVSVCAPEHGLYMHMSYVYVKCGYVRTSMCLQVRICTYIFEGALCGTCVYYCGQVCIWPCMNVSLYRMCSYCM